MKREWSIELFEIADRLVVIAEQMNDSSHTCGSCTANRYEDFIEKTVKRTLLGVVKKLRDSASSLLRGAKGEEE